MAGAIGSGERLKDRYRLERTLGRGGMAAVWLGHDEVLDRPVAVKVLSDTIASDPDFVLRFRREARTAAGLSHPNLVGIYDFSEEGERPYLVMQLAPGEDLASRLRRGERIDCDQLARELLDALAHIHEAGILHRDVKPANIVLEPNGTAKLIDFGIALPRDATSLTSTGLVLGTERYTAPEVMEGRPATVRSDLYSCGLVLRSCEGPCSAALRSLVAAMASERPGDRPPSARRALARLQPGDAAGGQPTEAFEPSFVETTERLPRTGARTPSSGPAPSGRSRPHGGRRGIAAAALGSAAVAVAVAVALVALAGGDDPAGRGDAEQAAQAQRGKGQGPSDAAGSVAVAPPPRPVGADPARGAALNEQGFAMIQAGEHAAAVPVLEEAVGAFPPETDDLDYAYALFNLGNALRLSGRPDEAIPVLERRLEIPNQEGEVRKELEAAYAAQGFARGKGPPHGRSRRRDR